MRSIHAFTVTHLLNFFAAFATLRELGFFHNNEGESEYDNAGRTTRILATSGTGTFISQFTYDYGADGNLAGKTDIQNGSTSVTTYGYDNANQLTDDGTITHTYDETGNRTDTGYSTDYGNRIYSDGTWNYTHDSNGNVTSAENLTTSVVWEYHYDAANHMTEVQRWSDSTPSKVLEYDADYKYNAFGLLVQKVIDSDGDTVTDETSRYALDGWNPAKANGLVGRENFAVTAKLDGSNALVAKYLWSDRIDDGLGRIDVGSPTEVRWTLTDFQKSVRTILDGNGGVIDSLAYDAFGNILPGETDATKRGDYAWTGREYDVETGLQYNRARWYDPTTGRWLTQDPLGFDAGDTNLYRYVQNQATGATDPSGLHPPYFPSAPDSRKDWGAYMDYQKSGRQQLEQREQYKYEQSLQPNGLQAGDSKGIVYSLFQMGKEKLKNGVQLGSEVRLFEGNMILGYIPSPVPGIIIYGSIAATFEMNVVKLPGGELAMQSELQIKIRITANYSFGAGSGRLERSKAIVPNFRWTRRDEQQGHGQFFPNIMADLKKTPLKGLGTEYAKEPGAFGSVSVGGKASANFATGKAIASVEIFRWDFGRGVEFPRSIKDVMKKLKLSSEWGWAGVGGSLELYGEGTVGWREVHRLNIKP